jgi:hypothetical protein
MTTTQERPGVALGAKQSQTSKRLLTQRLEMTEAGRRALADLRDGGCVGCDSANVATDGSLLPTRTYRVVHRDGRTESPVRYCAACVEVVATERDIDQIASVQLVHPAPGSPSSTFAVYSDPLFDDAGRLWHCGAAAFGFFTLAQAMGYLCQASRRDARASFVVMCDDDVVWAGRLVAGIALAAQFLEIVPPLIGEYSDYARDGGNDDASH